MTAVRVYVGIDLGNFPLPKGINFGFSLKY
jgi:hypothetical protein